MKGLTFKLLAEVVIALVAAWVLFSIFQRFVPPYTGPAMCKFYQVVLMIPLPAQLKPTIKECSIVDAVEEHVTLDGKDAAIHLADYAWLCWKKADNGKSGISIPCFDILFKNIEQPVKEVHVTQVLAAKGYCDSLQNNYLDADRGNINCGNENKLYWGADDLIGRDITVIIKYNAFTHRLELRAG